MSVTLWGRNGHPGSLEAIKFLEEHGIEVDRFLDLDRQPPTGEEWAKLRKALGGDIRRVVDIQHPRFTQVVPESLGGLSEERLEKVLEAEPMIMKAPILSTDEAALVGFGKEKWARFLNIDLDKSDGSA